MRVAVLVLLLAACADDPVAPLQRGDPHAKDVRPPLAVPDDVDIVVPGVVVDDVAPDRLGPPYPVVLVHGFSGWTDFGPLEYFFDVVDDLYATRGEVVVAPALPPYDASDQRAIVLAAAVDDVLARTNKAKVHLIAHSQGGLDSRYLISTLGYGDRVATLTTISTPHRGTPMADVAEVAPDGAMNAAGRFLGWLIGALEDPDEDAPIADVWQPEMASVIAFLSTTGANEFNVANQDDPRVAYFSVAGVSNLVPPSLVDTCADRAWEAPDIPDAVDPFLLVVGEIITASDGIFSWRSNDGLVPVDSAVWGTFLGCFPADHFDEIGQIADTVPGVDGFDHRELYRRLVDHVRANE